MFAMVAFFDYWFVGNVGGLIRAIKNLAGLIITTATFSAITIAGMFVRQMVGDKIGRKNAFILYEAIHIISMIVGAFSPI